MNPFKAFLATLFSKTKTQSIALDINAIYDIKINTLQGRPIDLKQFKGKYILFVNVASKCGFTSQYEQLQDLYKHYNTKLEIIGVPCNQFGGQEAGDANTIASFCEINYGISFTMTEKIEVKGKNQHKLYTWLTHKNCNGVKDTSVKWNFQKYLIDPNGDFVDYYFSSTRPSSSKITKYLN